MKDLDATAFAVLSRLLDQALDLPEAERVAWVEGLPPEHDDVKPRLLALLSSGARRTSLLDRFPELDLGEEGAPGESEPGLRPLRPGESLGRYQIRGLLGAGGMGRVYRAFDPVLQREVAIKALAGPFREDPASLRRVAREARLLATLNHPNVATIHGLEPLDGVPHLILELVEGETLAARLSRGALPQAEALAVAVQVAAALEEAHRKGIVHRDLKPANVKLDPEGRVKVLDFGIAVALVPAAGEDPGSGPLTRADVVPGTAPYMSPEQIRGRPVDTRSDVWSFGCLLYEMVTGAPAFAGATSPEVMAAVLHDPVRWERLPPDTRPAVRRVLDRCLRREPRERLQAIGDARIELSELAASEANPVARRGPRRLWPAAAAAVALAAMAAWLVRPGAEPPLPRLVQLTVELPAGLSLGGGIAPPFAVSPDGSRLAIAALRAGSRRLVVRRLDDAQVRELEGTEGAWQPTFSPDGAEIAFFADRKLKKVATAGGPVTTLAELGENPRGASWTPDGRVVFSASQVSGLSSVPASGGPVTPLTALDLSRGESSHRWPQVLPGGRHVLFTTGLDAASFDDARIELLSLATGERRVLLEGGAQGRYAAGYLLHAHAGQLFASRFDPDGAGAAGPPALLVEDVIYDPRNGGTHYALSAGAVLVYAPGHQSPPEHHLAWVDAAGLLTRIGGPPRRFREPRLSPDGRHVAVVIGRVSGADLWVVDARSGALDRASRGLSPHRPVWTPDGRGITVGAEAQGRWRLLTLPAGGVGTAVTLLEGPHRLYPDAWAPDGGSLIFEERRPGTGWDLRQVEVGPDGRAAGPARDLLATPFEERNAALSADGRLLAFESNELDGVNGVYVASLPGPAAKVRATPTFANWPRWGAGQSLYYWYPAQVRPGDGRDLDGIYRLQWRAGGTGPTAAPEPAWPPVRQTADRIVLGPYAPFDVDSSGPRPRFLVLETSAPRLTPDLGGTAVVLGWQELLRPGAARR